MATTFYATNNFTGDGTTVNWNINFADGYIDLTNVKARYLDNTGSYVDIAISSVAGNVVTISPAVANGQEFQIYRDTEKRFPLVDFSDGAILNETNLDTLATQAVMVSAEAFDQSNNGVRIAGDSLVIAQGIDAKAQEALDNSEDALTTANGIAATAAQALTNSNTAVSTANAANSTANGIAATANQALTNSNTAITTANGAVTTANDAESTANGIDAKATTAINTANSAVATANSASTKADTAIITANSAVATANAIDGKAQTALDNVAALDATAMKKAANLSDIADKAAAWLNVRPIGSTPLASDPVGDYDAATKGWVENLINTGTVGPTMNGVMNYGVGQITLWHSRASIPSYSVFADGQLLSRADYPELWAHAQMHSPLADSVWLGDNKNRAKFSTGDGSTTFRVPDLNGTQAGSVENLFGRGSNGYDVVLPGTIFASALPNISGALTQAMIGNANVASGAFQTAVSGTYGYGADIDAAPIKWKYLSFSAEQSNPVYGRYNTTEVVPNSFVGVWIIRANGGFVAANTQWSVLNGDAVLPPSSTVVRGGAVKSGYTVGGALRKEVSLTSYETIGGSTTQSGAEIITGSASYKFTDAGTMIASQIWSLSDVTSTGALVSRGTGYPSLQLYPTGYSASTTSAGAANTLEASGTDGYVSTVNLIRRRGDGSPVDQVVVSFPTTAGTLALQGTSGIAYKKDVVDADANDALGRILGQRLVNFVYTDDEQERVRFGVIAEEAEVVAPQYIKHNDEPYEDILDAEGNKVGELTRDRPSVDNNPIIMDLMGCIHALNAKIEALEARIDELTSQ